jgi:rhodanese-related sulfurtransferase
MTDCSVLRIDSERLDQMLTWSAVADYLQLNIARQRDLDEDVDWMMTVLKSNLFFKVPPLNVEEIFARLEPQVVYADEVIIREGEVGEHCYFIKEGRAEVSRRQNDRQEYLADIYVGRCFGEDALVNDAPRNATVRMRTDGVLMRLAKQDFYRLLKAPQVAQVALEQLLSSIAEGAVLVDVRSEEEYAEQHLARAVNIPLSLLAIKMRMLRDNMSYIFYCDTGRRSQAAAHLMARQGFKALALADCVDLFRDARWRELLAERGNYVLREGVAVPGQ